MKIKIYYEDTDANNIAYHTAYMRFCERDRSEIFFKNGKTPLNDKSFFVVKNLNANFIGSVSLGDEVIVKTSLKTMKKTSAILFQEIYFKDVVIFNMDVTIVYLESGKVSRMPEEFCDMLSAL